MSWSLRVTESKAKPLWPSHQQLVAVSLCCSCSRASCREGLWATRCRCPACATAILACRWAARALCARSPWPAALTAGPSSASVPSPAPSRRRRPPGRPPADAAAPSSPAAPRCERAGRWRQPARITPAGHTHDVTWRRHKEIEQKETPFQSPTCVSGLREPRWSHHVAIRARGGEGGEQEDRTATLFVPSLRNHRDGSPRRPRKQVCCRSGPAAQAVTAGRLPFVQIYVCNS